MINLWSYFGEISRIFIRHVGFPKGDYSIAQLFAGKYYCPLKESAVRTVDSLVLDQREASTFLPRRELKANPVKAAHLLIDLLDLSRPKDSTCEEEGWTIQQANEAEKWYKLFLKLNVICPKADMVPPKDADRLWHAHILHTRQYHRDCNLIFGSYLHHHPFGNTQTQEMVEKRVHDTIQLFLRHFGEAPSELHWLCNNCSSCGTK